MRGERLIGAQISVRLWVEQPECFPPLGETWHAYGQGDAFAGPINFSLLFHADLNCLMNSEQACYQRDQCCYTLAEYAQKCQESERSEPEILRAWI